MRSLLTRLAPAAIVAGLTFGLSPASAAPLPKLDGLASQTNAVETVGYRYHRHGYGRRPYNRYGYYGYGYRPYYGYGYRPYYRPWYRPYYRPYWNYWW